METILYLDEDDVEDFKKKIEKLGKYKKDVITITFFNFAYLKNPVLKWHEVTINIKEYKKE